MCMCITYVGVVDVATEWMVDLKEGWCTHQGFYNKEACCWLSNDTLNDENCTLWSKWSTMAGVEAATSAYVLDYVVYVSLAVILAGLAGLFVTVLAPYASGSGIPEVRTCKCACM